MELTTRILVFLLIVAVGLGAGAALGKAYFYPDPGQQEIDADDEYYPEQYRIPFTTDVQLFGDFVILW